MKFHIILLASLLCLAIASKANGAENDDGLVSGNVQKCSGFLRACDDPKIKKNDDPSTKKKCCPGYKCQPGIGSRVGNSSWGKCVEN